MIRVLIVDDHPLVRESVCAVIDQESDFVACNAVETGEAALEAITVELPDIVLIDVFMPGMSGIELAGILRQRYPRLPLAILSGHGERKHVDQALEAGAAGYILKGDADELVLAIRTIVRGERYLSPALRSGR